MEIPEKGREKANTKQERVENIKIGCSQALHKHNINLLSSVLCCLTHSVCFHNRKVLADYSNISIMWMMSQNVPERQEV